MTADPTIAETLATVKGYLAVGLSCIPVKADGSKAPAIMGWRQFATAHPTPQQVWEWFGPDAPTRYGVGIPGGAASGNLAVLDFETGEAWDCWRANISSDTADFLDECPVVRAPRGGVHLYVRLPEPVPGVKLARDKAGKTLVEIRGDNHQVVAPGSPAACHPSGKLYQWEHRGWLDDGFHSPVPFSVWFDWIALAEGMNEYAPPTPERHAAPPRERSPSDDDPGRDFNRRGTWEDTGLFEAGWTWAKELEYGKGFVRRPGKAKGQSGTIGMIHSKANAWPFFFCFSTDGSIHPFEPEKPYDKFGVYARLKHRGDFPAAAGDLARRGYGKPNPALAARAKPTPAVATAPAGDPSPPPSPPTPPESVSPPVAAPDKKAPKSRFKFEDVADFLAGDYRPRWLVPRILVRGQPGVIAAPSKGMKTSILIDLAVSLATATAFLGKFPIRERVRVAVCSGESGEHTIKETVLRVLAAKGLTGADAAGWLKMEFNLPCFTDVASMCDFAGHLERLEADVVVIDPTYLAMGDVDAKNLFEMGGALRAVADHLKKARPDLTVILVHHANRMLPVGEVMELQHLAYSGLEQFARQFFLMNRREPYKNNGVHDLWFRVGGSSGHGGLWALHIDEGLVEEDFSGRRWEVTVSTPDEADDDASAAKDRAIREKVRTRNTIDDDAVLLTIDAEAAKGHPGASVSWIGDHVDFGDERVRKAVDRLLERGAIIKVPEFQKKSGKGAMVWVRNGFGRPPEE